ncbi:DUF4123 domain-containing protein [uncultured Shewanella sp.]|uniref:DUF4123 domain-containing protein n=1 Tax=uncultured Shewanella sp. TaxID=173975 RepID=UPI00261606C8|nr:DUF4123 domain-containing protein [uncultured Shewanella sp.]
MTPIDFDQIALAPNEKRWAMIDRADHYLKWLYENNPAPNYEYLFDDTELIDVMQVGPIVLALNNDADLVWLNEKAQSDDKMSLMIISSSLTTEQVLAKLRANTIVMFAENRKGIFRYFDKRVASYFFQHENLNNLFHGFSAIYWFGNTYGQLETQGHRWWGCFNDSDSHNPEFVHSTSHLDGALPARPIVRLNQGQMQRLNRMQQDKQALLRASKIAQPEFVQAPKQLIPSVFSQ